MNSDEVNNLVKLQATEGKVGTVFSEEEKQVFKDRQNDGSIRGKVGIQRQAK